MTRISCLALLSAAWGACLWPSALTLSALAVAALATAGNVWLDRKIAREAKESAR